MIPLVIITGSYIQIVSIVKQNNVESNLCAARSQKHKKFSAEVVAGDSDDTASKPETECFLMSDMNNGHTIVRCDSPHRNKLATEIDNTHAEGNCFHQGNSNNGYYYTYHQRMITHKNQSNSDIFNKVSSRLSAKIMKKSNSFVTFSERRRTGHCIETAIGSEVIQQPGNTSQRRRGRSGQEDTCCSRRPLLYNRIIHRQRRDVRNVLCNVRALYNTRSARCKDSRYGWEHFRPVNTRYLGL